MFTLACKVQQVQSQKIVAEAARMCNRRGWCKENLSIAPVVNCHGTEGVLELPELHAGYATVLMIPLTIPYPPFLLFLPTPSHL